MTGMDAEALWEWVRDNPPETIEQFVLTHVRILRGEEAPPRSNSVFSNRRGRTIYEVLDKDNRQLLTLTISDKQAKAKDFTPAKAITEALLKHVICVKCGTRLLVGEHTVCSTCEATQIMDLVRIQRDLSE